MEQKNNDILDEVQRMKDAYSELAKAEDAYISVISARSGMGKTSLLNKMLVENGLEPDEGFIRILPTLNPKEMSRSLIANDGTYVDFHSGKVLPKIIVLDNFDHVDYFIKNDFILDSLTAPNGRMIEEPDTKENHQMEAKIVILTTSCIPDIEMKTPFLEHFFDNVDSRVTILSDEDDYLVYLGAIYENIPLYGQNFTSTDEEYELREQAVKLILSEWKRFSKGTIPTFLFAKVVNYMNKNKDWEKNKSRIYRL